MATKRQAPDDSQPHSKSSWKRQKPNNPHLSRPNHGKNSFKKAHAVNDLKSEIRSLRRLLSRNDDLPAGVRVEKERALQTAQRELDKQQRAKKRSEVISRWHKVRFFERQKAERRLKKAKKALKEAREKGEEMEQFGREVEQCEIEVAYAVYFPLERDYVPLFRKMREEGEEGVDEENEEGTVVDRHGDKEMWEAVKQCMREGTLKDLREGRVRQNDEDEQENIAMTSVKKYKKSRNESEMRRENKQKETKDEDESGDESGGGFFE